LVVPATRLRTKALGDAIRTYRKKVNLTQERLAERADLNYKYLGEVERGEKTISVEALARIAQALNVRMAKLVEKL
jgi:transcriptional regulator with XRE-family HTH domain